MNTNIASLLDTATRHLFFTGKGGVGKTSLACASALALADGGKRVLIVSTDPASNLDEVLGIRLSPVPAAIPGCARLFALNLDPEVAAQAYRERIVGPYRGKLPASAIRSMEEQLSGACTLELAAFDEFSKLLGDPAATIEFDHVIFDTAPTGHTLRLLALPKAWSGFLVENTSGTSCLGPLAGLQKQRALYEASVAALADGKQTTVVLVSRAQRAALQEAERTSGELAALGVGNQLLMLNGLFHASTSDDITAQALERRGIEALEEMAGFIASMRVCEIRLRPHNLLGIEALRALVREEVTSVFSAVNPQFHAAPSATETLGELVDDLARTERGVIMTMGKGGVGKTTLAAAIATELAERGFKVHLSTTDPAAHVAAAVESHANVKLSRIDALKETQDYVAQVIATAGEGLDAEGLALLEEDLRSPCTEEIAVFRAFARIVADGQTGFVVLDTAPTGHTLLLLDATESYHREVARKASDVPEEVRQLLPRLRDANYTRVLIVTLPEATPVHEAARLQDDLRRAQIEPFAWIVNQSFRFSGSHDPLLVMRGENEVRFIEEARGLAKRLILVPWVAEVPSGAKGLQQLFATTVGAMER